MFVTNPYEFDAKQHRSIVCGIVSMLRRGKDCKYVSGINDQSVKSFYYL